MAYLNDLRVGQKSAFGSYPVTREAVIAFAEQFDPQPFHLSDEGAAGTPFGRIAASGFHTAAAMMRMIVEEWDDTSGNLGGIGIDELRWLKPVHPGDTLRCETEVLELIPSRSKPDRGVSKLRWTALNQHDQPVLTMVAIGMHKLRPYADAPVTG